MTISALYAFKSKNHETDNFVCIDNDKHMCDGRRSDCEDKLLDSIDKVAEAQIPSGKKISENRAMEEKNRKRRGSRRQLTDSKDIKVKFSLITITKYIILYYMHSKII